MKLLSFKRKKTNFFFGHESVYASVSGLWTVNFIEEKNVSFLPKAQM